VLPNGNEVGEFVGIVTQEERRIEIELPAASIDPLDVRFLVQTNDGTDTTKNSFGLFPT
jgi:hypothetical protein